MIPSVTVPLALAGSAAAMYLLNFGLDNLSLMALTIAVGFVVDDAILVVENIYQHVEEGMTPLEAAVKGSCEIGFTVGKYARSCGLSTNGVIGRPLTPAFATSALLYKDSSYHIMRRTCVPDD